MHPAFPTPEDSDAEDVAWGLTTGGALWRQGEKYDAIVWLKRAVDSATEAGLSARADELNRAATELLASLSGRIAPMASAAPPPRSPTAAPPPPAKMAPPPPAAAVAPPPARHPPPPMTMSAPPPPPKAPPVRPRMGAQPAPPPPPPPPPPARSSSGEARGGGRHFPPLPPGPPPRTPLPARPRGSPIPPIHEPEAHVASDRARDSRPNPAFIDAAIREALAQTPGMAGPLHIEDPFPRPAPTTGHPTEEPLPRRVVKRDPLQTEVDEETEVDDVEGDVADVADVEDDDETIALRSHRDVDDDDETIALPSRRVVDDDDETIALPSRRVVLESSPSTEDETLSLAPVRSVPVSTSPVPSTAPSPMPPATPPSAHPVQSSPVPPPAAPAGGRSSSLPPAPLFTRSSPVPMTAPSSAPASSPPSASPASAPPASAPREVARNPLPPARAMGRSSPLPPAPNASVRQGAEPFSPRPSHPPHGWGSSPSAPFRQSPLPPLPPSVAPPPISLDALGQLSPARREALLQAATIESLGAEEEVTVSGLAFVITGQASIQATVAEASAGVLNPGELLYAKSPIAETVSLRLVAEADSTQIALWDAKTADEALSAAPELLERLKVASARIQAIVGCSMGAMGERLDESLRTLAIERLETRILQPHEVLAPAGLPVPGLVIVGVGTVDLDDDGEEARDSLMPGDFLFATEVLGAEAAPATARAGAKGAIVLFGARAVAHELLVTCPPLLEIFAGM